MGRPHIAQVMLSMGAVANFKEAFTRYLGIHGRAYVPKDKLTVEHAFELLHSEGALTILAHPYILGLSGPALAETVGRYRKRGLTASRPSTPNTPRPKHWKYLALARRFGLAVSGGSDFHGSAKPEVEIGRGRGTLRVDITILDALKARLVRRASLEKADEDAKKA
ncbi:MAG: PHP domain-containing protein [Solidesulfovibrio sp.]